MPFVPPSWVLPLPRTQVFDMHPSDLSVNDLLPEIPDSIPIFQFLLEEAHGRCRFKESKNPFTCGLSGTTYTLQEMARRVEFLARTISQELGWHPNRGTEWDKVVGIFSLNTIDFITLACAIHRLSGIVTPANSAYSASELEFQLKSSGAKALFTCEPLLEISLRVAKTVGIPDNRVYLLDMPKEFSSSKRPSQKTLGDLILMGASNPEIEALIWGKGQSEKQTAYICYSSGTSGLPKGVMISHKNVISNVIQLATYDKPARDQREACQSDISLGLLPFSHIYGLVVVALARTWQGDEVIVLPKFELDSFLNAIQTRKIQTLYVVPPIIIQMLKNTQICRKYDLSSVRSMFTGAAPLGSETAEELHRIYPSWIIRQGYGLTETCTVVSSTPEQDVYFGSSGSLLPGVTVKIVSSDGVEVTEHDKPGELVVQSPSVVLGYLKNKKANFETFIEDSDGKGRWMRTGDEALIRKSAMGNEHVFIVDRIKELIKVKGLQVAPAELEAHLLSHPSIADCAVIPIPDDAAGEVPKAFVVKSASVGLDNEHIVAREICKFVEDHKARHKWLKGGVEFIDVIPKSPSGKILRRLLRNKLKTVTSAQRAKL